MTTIPEEIESETNDTFIEIDENYVRNLKRKQKERGEKKDEPAALH